MLLAAVNVSFVHCVFCILIVLPHVYDFHCDVYHTNVMLIEIHGIRQNNVCGILGDILSLNFIIIFF